MCDETPIFSPENRPAGTTEGEVLSAILNRLRTLEKTRTIPERVAMISLLDSAREQFEKFKRRTMECLP